MLLSTAVSPRSPTKTEDDDLAVPTLGASDDSRYQHFKRQIVTRNGSHFTRYLHDAKESLTKLEADIPYLANLLQEAAALDDADKDIMAASLELVDDALPTEVLTAFWGKAHPDMTPEFSKLLFQKISALHSLEAQMRYFILIMRIFGDTGWGRVAYQAAIGEQFDACGNLAEAMRTRDISAARFLSRCAGGEPDEDALHTLDAIFMEYSDKTDPTNLIPENHWLLSKAGLDLSLLTGARYICYLHQTRKTLHWKRVQEWLQQGEADPTQFIETLPLATISMLLFDTRLYRMHKMQVKFVDRLWERHSGATQILRLLADPDPAGIYKEIDRNNWTPYPISRRSPFRIQDDREALVTALFSVGCYLPSIPKGRPVTDACEAFNLLSVPPMVPIHHAMHHHVYDVINLNLSKQPTALATFLQFKGLSAGVTMHIPQYRPVDVSFSSPNIKKVRPLPEIISLDHLKRSTKSSTPREQLFKYYKMYGIELDTDATCRDKSDCEEKAQQGMATNIKNELIKLGLEASEASALLFPFRKLAFEESLEAFQKFKRIISDGDIDKRTVRYILAGEPVPPKEAPPRKLRPVRREQPLDEDLYDLERPRMTPIESVTRDRVGYEKGRTEMPASPSKVYDSFQRASAKSRRRITDEADREELPPSTIPRRTRREPEEELSGYDGSEEELLPSIIPRHSRREIKRELSSHDGSEEELPFRTTSKRSKRIPEEDLPSRDDSEEDFVLQKRSHREKSYPSQQTGTSSRKPFDPCERRDYAQSIPLFKSSIRTQHGPHKKVSFEEPELEQGAPLKSRRQSIFLKHPSQRRTFSEEPESSHARPQRRTFSEELELPPVRSKRHTFFRELELPPTRAQRRAVSEEPRLSPKRSQTRAFSEEPELSHARPQRRTLSEEPELSHARPQRRTVVEVPEAAHKPPPKVQQQYAPPEYSPQKRVFFEEPQIFREPPLRTQLKHDSIDHPPERSSSRPEVSFTRSSGDAAFNVPTHEYQPQRVPIEEPDIPTYQRSKRENELPSMMDEILGRITGYCDDSCRAAIRRALRSGYTVAGNFYEWLNARTQYGAVIGEYHSDPRMLEIALGHALWMQEFARKIDESNRTWLGSFGSMIGFGSKPYMAGEQAVAALNQIEMMEPGFIAKIMVDREHDISKELLTWLKAKAAYGPYVSSRFVKKFWNQKNTSETLLADVARIDPQMAEDLDTMIHDGVDVINVSELQLDDASLAKVQPYLRPSARPSEDPQFLMTQLDIPGLDQDLIMHSYEDLETEEEKVEFIHALQGAVQEGYRYTAGIVNYFKNKAIFGVALGPFDPEKWAYVEDIEVLVRNSEFIRRVMELMDLPTGSGFVGGLKMVFGYRKAMDYPLTGAQTAKLLHRIEAKEPGFTKNLRLAVTPIDLVDDGYINWLRAKAAYPNLFPNDFLEIEPYEWHFPGEAIQTILAFIRAGDSLLAETLLHSLTGDDLRDLEILLGFVTLDTPIVPQQTNLETVQVELVQVVGEKEAARMIAELEKDASFVDSLTSHFKKGLQNTRGYLLWLSARVKFGSSIPSEYDAEDWKDDGTAFNTIVDALEEENPTMAVSVQDQNAKGLGIDEILGRRGDDVVAAEDVATQLAQVVGEEESSRIVNGLAENTSPSFLATLKGYFSAGLLKSRGFLDWLSARARFGNVIPEYREEDWSDEQTAVSFILENVRKARGQSEAVRLDNEAMGNLDVLLNRPSPAVGDVIVNMLAQQLDGDREMAQEIASVLQARHGEKAISWFSTLSAYISGGYDVAAGYLRWLRAKATFGSAISEVFREDEWRDEATANATIIDGVRRNDENLANALKEKVAKAKANPTAGFELLVGSRNLVKGSRLPHLDRIPGPGVHKKTGALKAMGREENDLLDLARDALEDRGFSSDVIEGAEDTVRTMLQRVSPENAARFAFFAVATRSEHLADVIKAAQELLGDRLDGDKLLERLAGYDLQTIQNFASIRVPTTLEAAQKAILLLNFPELMETNLDLSGVSLSEKITGLLVRMGLLSKEQKDYLQMRPLSAEEAKGIMNDLLNVGADNKKGFADQLQSRFGDFLARLTNLHLTDFMPGLPSIPCVSYLDCLAKIRALLPDFYLAQLKKAGVSPGEEAELSRAFSQQSPANQRRLLSCVYDAVRAGLASSPYFTKWLHFKTMAPTVVSDSPASWSNTENAKNEAAAAILGAFPEAGNAVEAAIRTVNTEDALNGLLSASRKALASPNGGTALVRGLASSTPNAEEAIASAVSDPTLLARLGIPWDDQTPESLVKIGRTVGVQAKAKDLAPFNNRLWKCIRKLIPVGAETANNEQKRLLRAMLLIPDLVRSKNFSRSQTFKGLLAEVAAKERGYPGQKWLWRNLIDALDERLLEDELARAGTKISDMIVELAVGMMRADEKSLYHWTTLLGSVLLGRELSVDDLSSNLPQIFKRCHVNLPWASLISSLLLQSTNIGLTLGSNEATHLTGALLDRLDKQQLATLDHEVNGNPDGMALIRRRLLATYKTPESARKHLLNAIAKEVEAMDDQELLYHPHYGPIILDILVREGSP